MIVADCILKAWERSSAGRRHYILPKCTLNRPILGFVQLKYVFIDKHLVTVEKQIYIEHGFSLLGVDFTILALHVGCIR